MSTQHGIILQQCCVFDTLSSTSASTSTAGKIKQLANVILLIWVLFICLLRTHLSIVYSQQWIIKIYMTKPEIYFNKPGCILFCTHVLLILLCYDMLITILLCFWLKEGLLYVSKETTELCDVDYLDIIFNFFLMRGDGGPTKPLSPGA